MSALSGRNNLSLNPVGLDQTTLITLSTTITGLFLSAFFFTLVSEKTVRHTEICPGPLSIL